MIYEFTLPVSKKSLTWRPLRVQESIDARAACKGMDEAALGVSLLIRRIVSFDGREGMPSQIEWGTWDELDLEFFDNEVTEKEGARRAVLRKAQIEGADPLADLKSSLIELQRVAGELGRAATAVLESAKIVEAKRDPLG